MLWRRLAGRAASLRVRLMAFSLAALIPGFAVVAITQHAAITARRAEVNDAAIRGARLAASELERILDGLHILMTAAALVPDIREARDPGCSLYAASVLRRAPGVSALALLGADGHYRCGSSPPPPGTSFADRDYVARAFAGADMALGEYTVGRLTSRPVLPAALAVRDAQGRAVGVLIASIDLAWLGEQLKERGVPPGGSLTVADRNGVIVARQPLFDRFLGTRIPADYLRLLHAPAAGAETVISQDGTLRVLGYVPVELGPSGLYVSAGLSVENSLGAARRTAWLGAILAACGGLAMLAATWIVGDRVFVRPLREIEAVLGRWRAGDLAARTGRRSEDGEIGALGAALDRLMDEIASMQEHRELLAGELVHRVKNTLAGVQAIAGMSLNRPEPGRALLPDFQARIAALAGTHEILTRAHWERAALADVARKVALPLCGDVDARFGFDGPPVVLSARDALGMTMVLHELCTNALKYGALSVPDGRISLRWSIARERDAGEHGGLLLELVWQERGGPPVAPGAPAAGFGTRMIQRALGQPGKVVLAFDPAGVTCRISLRLEPGPGGASDEAGEV